jgi:hypothetical protein
LKADWKVLFHDKYCGLLATYLNAANPNIQPENVMLSTLHSGLTTNPANC